MSDREFQTFRFNHQYAVWTLMACTSFILTLIGPTKSEEYFGQFSEGPSGEFVDTQGRPHFRLGGMFSFQDPNGLNWVVPADTMVDGASIPQIFWSFIGGPFEGRYLKASIIHDHFCRTKTRTAHDTHRNFYYGMRANGVSVWKAKAMHWAVSTFGPNWIIRKRVVDSVDCSPQADGMKTCINTPTIEETTVLVQGVDLDDPEVLAVALGKFAAVARTLKTTEGATLDVLPTGTIDASFDSIEANSTSVRELMSTGTYERYPDALGVMLEPEVVELDALESWPDNSVPSLTDLPDFQTFMVGGETKGFGVVLEAGDLKQYQQGLKLAPTQFNLDFQP